MLAAYESGEFGPMLWAGAMLGALMTAIYSFRLVFIVFFGETKTEPHAPVGFRMGGPLMLLAVLAIIGGWFSLHLGEVFPPEQHPHPSHLIHYTTMAVPLIGLVLSYLFFMTKILPVAAIVGSPLGKKLGHFWLKGWQMDALYDMLFVKPYKKLSFVLRNEMVDLIYHGIVGVSRAFNRLLSGLQNGRLSRYAASMILGLIVLLTLLLGIY